MASSYVTSGRDLGPSRKGLRARSPVFKGGVICATEVEEICDLIVNGQESLDLSRPFKTFHDPLSSPCWLVGVLRPIVDALVLAVFEFHAHALARRAVRSELVGDQNTRSTGLLTDEFA